MQIDSYFGLTIALGRKLMKRRFSGEQGQTEGSGEDKHRQYEYYDKDQGKYVLTINAVSEGLVVVSVVLPSNAKVASALVNWNEEEIRSQVSLPLSEDEISERLESWFESKMGDIIALFGSFSQESKLLEISDVEQDKRTPRVDLPSAPSIGRDGLREPIVQSRIPTGTRRPPDMPGFDDEYEMSPQRVDPITGATFPSIGERDLNPPGLSRHPPLKPYLDPQNPGLDGGMYPTPEHPIFGSRSSGNSSRLGVPPGARFDDPVAEDDLDMLGAGLPGSLRNGPRGPSGFGPHPGLGGFPPGPSNNGPFGF